MAEVESDLSLAELLRQVVEILSSRNIEFALAGGLVADLYRSEPRGTGDLDVVVAIMDQDVNRARDVITSLGYEAGVATKEMLEGNARFRRKAQRGTPQIVVGRNKARPYGIDLLLLSLPWTKRSLERAKSNLIDFNKIGLIPCLTEEDIIISKLYALKNSPERRYKKYDIPDIAQIFDQNKDLDLNYLSDCMLEHELILPKVIEDHVAPVLRRLSKRLRKRQRGATY